MFEHQKQQSYFILFTTLLKNSFFVSDYHQTWTWNLIEWNTNSSVHLNHLSESLKSSMKVRLWFIIWHPSFPSFFKCIIFVLETIQYFLILQTFIYYCCFVVCRFNQEPYRPERSFTTSKTFCAKGNNKLHNNTSKSLENILVCYFVVLLLLLFCNLIASIRRSMLQDCC